MAQLLQHLNEKELINTYEGSITLMWLQRKARNLLQQCWLNKEKLTVIIINIYVFHTRPIIKLIQWYYNTARIVVKRRNVHCWCTGVDLKEKRQFKDNMQLYGQSQKMTQLFVFFWGGSALPNNNPPQKEHNGRHVCEPNENEYSVYITYSLGTHK